MDASLTLLFSKSRSIVDRFLNEFQLSEEIDNLSPNKNDFLLTGTSVSKDWDIVKNFLRTIPTNADIDNLIPDKAELKE